MKMLLRSFLVLPMSLLMSGEVRVDSNIPFPDPSHNAALSFFKAMLLPMTHQSGIVGSGPTAFPTTWPLPDPEVDKTFLDSRINATLSLMAIGAAKSYCDWGCDFHNEATVNIETTSYNSFARSMIRLCGLRARWHASRREDQSVVDDLLVGLRTARLWAGQRPGIFDILVGSDMEQHAIVFCAVVAPNLTLIQRKRLAAALTTLPISATYADSLTQERTRVEAAINNLLSVPPDDRMKYFADRSVNGDWTWAPFNKTADMASVGSELSDKALNQFLIAYRQENARLQEHLRQPLANSIKAISPPLFSGEPPSHLYGSLQSFAEWAGTNQARLLIKREQLLAALAYLDSGELGLAEHPSPMTEALFRLEKAGTDFDLCADLSGKEVRLLVGERPNYNINKKTLNDDIIIQRQKPFPEEPNF